MLRVILLFVVLFCVGCVQSSPTTAPTADESKPSSTKLTDFAKVDPGTMLIATNDGAAAVDPLSYRELMQRIKADDDIGLKKLVEKKQVVPFDKGQRFKLIVVHNDRLETTEGTAYRLQVRAVGGPLADQELYVVSALVKPE